jgi:hypothetical protein
MKKLIAMLTVGAFLAVSTVGCGPATPTPTGTAAPNSNSKETSVTGKVVSSTSDSLKLTDKDDKSASFTVPTDVKPTLDGKDVALSDLKEGNAVTVTKLGDKVTKVEAKSK